MSNKSMAKRINLAFYILEFITLLALVLKNELHYVGDTIFAMATYTIILIFEKKGWISFQNYIRVLLVTTMLSHNLIGELFTLYDTTEFFDMLLHGFGTFSIALFLFVSIRSITKITLQGSLQYFIIVTAIGLASGALFETGEFILDVMLKVKNQQDLLDTNLDMIFNIFGALAAGLFAARKKSLV